MLNLRNSVLPVSAIFADLDLHAFVGKHHHTCVVLHGYFADVLARRYRLASNKYTVCKSANMKVYQSSVMISNSLYEETNEQYIFF